MSFQYKHGVAVIYAVILFLDRLDLTIVNVTLPTLAKVFHVSIIATDWVSIAYLLALAISIPISSWFGARFGRKKIYIIAMLLFASGSTLCALAPNLTTLISLRFIQGIGGGMLIPTGMTILYRLYDKSEYASITSFTFIPALIAPAIAPLLGGILLDNGNWQAVFLFSGPICLVLAIIAYFVLHADSSNSKRSLDIYGFLLFAALLIDIFYTLSLIGKPATAYLVAAGGALFGLLTYAFVKHERQSAQPLFDLRYFQQATFIKTNILQLCFQICHYGSIFLVCMYLRVGLGMAASTTGLIMGMQALGAMLSSRYSVKLFNQYGAKLPLNIGLTGIAIVSLSILSIRSADMLVTALILFFVRGMFDGLCGTPIQTLSILCFEKHQIADINTIFNAFREISISVGVAISSGLLAVGMGYAKISLDSQINAQNAEQVFGLGFLILPVIAFIGVAVVATLKLPPTGTKLESNVISPKVS